MDLERIAPFVSNLDRKVFALFGLPEEVIAVLFAYYSRSRDDLRTNLARLLADEELGIAGGSATQAAQAQDKARAFHEKWVVGYGHASVAEHAVVHLALEDVSIVASKVIEDLRLGSFTEKSTRYVVFDARSFADLPELPPELRSVYRASCEKLFGVYLELQPRVEERVRELAPKRPGQSDAAWNAAVRSHTCDLLRGLLPAGTLTNLGITANARAMAMLISKMLSWPLDEVKRIAGDMRTEALVVAPTLLRHAARNDFREAIAGDIAPAAAALQGAARREEAAHVPVRLVQFDADAMERVVLALSYDCGESADADARLQSLRAEPRDKLQAVVDAAMLHRGAYDPAPRAFEASSVTVELEVDYGAYRDLQRHRILTPLVRTLGCTLGAYVSEDLEAMGHGPRVKQALEEARGAWERIASSHPFEAQYAVPLAYRVRTLWTLNLRELFHVIELRSGKQGHASYRRVAQELYRAVVAVHPWLAKLIRADMESYRLARE
ncbi:MAG: FAD-dependent thymidylate synthase [Deltaproteobacteria bacterium]|nr:FAD-dependent thymidylate synthase [Deltaproteobacteria bacterium]